MNDVSAPSSMQIVAYNNTQQLLFDASNSQLFYLYNPTTKQLTAVSNNDAQTFYNTAPNQQFGYCGWGHTQTEGSHLSNNSIN